MCAERLRKTCCAEPSRNSAAQGIRCRSSFRPCSARCDFFTGAERPVLPLACGQRGFSLVELVVFIVVVSIGLAGVLGALDYSNRASVNPMLLKQQVAIAESLLEEVSSKPFTLCDPDDPSAATAEVATDCSVVQGIGPTAGETRNSSTTPFDNVGDYHGYAMNAGILNPASGAVISGLGSYRASIAVSLAGTALGLADNTAGLRIEVSVTAPDGNLITLTGYRSRYAPKI